MSRKRKGERICALCGGPANEEHHLIHGSGRRKLAEEDGLKIDVCTRCHTLGPKAIHNNPELDRELQKLGEMMWLEKTGGTVEDFIQRYGKNYISEEVEDGEGDVYQVQ